MTAEFPEKLEFLFEPHRYKVAYGGRGAAKSWGFARALLIQAAQRPLRVLCARELQRSIADSVHKLLSDQIRDLGLQDVYRIEQARIVGANGSEFIFAGLKHNVTSIKSLEACDIVWVEEAQSVSKASWDVLIPTIRKEGSEVWASFNPDLEQDETYRRFVITPPPGAVVCKINYPDNPWFPEVLRKEMEHCRTTDPDAYQHVWLGCCISVLEGAIYANELRAADRDGRVTRVPYDPQFPVSTYWDIGYGDRTAIWFVQSVAFEHRIIDYLDGSGQGLQYYLQLLQSRGYVYGTHWLPWDARPKQFGSGKSVEELMRQAGFTVEVMPRLSVADGITATRTVFPKCWFDQQKCADGLQALRHYRYGRIEATGAPTREPLHDEYSHGADAFRTFGVSSRPPDKKAVEVDIFDPFAAGGAGGWMA
jgi:phage terminase large subunit